jgi:hypothetical protein
VNRRGLAIAVGLLAGGFLYVQFGFGTRDNFSDWQWYQAAAFLTGAGLAGIFPEVWLSATIALVTAPTLAAAAQTCFQLVKDPTCCNLWPIGLAMVFFFGLPASLLGVGIGNRLARERLPRLVHAATLAGGVLLAALLPHIRYTEQLRLESKTIPGILHEIHDAEMAYSASQPDGSFTCDGTQLPGVAGRLGWKRSSNSTRLRTSFSVQRYFIFLDCSNDVSPRGFLARATPGFSIDQTGKLVAPIHP